MKPIYIEMDAFGSYQKECIDFEKVNHGLFLITGDTGAGKTTIFDAITYALFDKTSGGKRDGEMMRSQYASPNIKTQVIFRFIYNGEKYTIIRSPKQDRWRKIESESGEYYEKLKTPISPEVELIMPDGTVFPGKKTETDEKIKEIIGLSVEQFTQIAMLAQGDFMKLLLAPSEERKEIFAKIFDTNIYALIERKINDWAKDINIQLSNNKKDIVREFERVVCPEESIFSEEWNTDKYQERFSESDRKGLLDLVSDICKESRKIQREIKDLKSLNDEKLNDINKKIEQADRINKLLNELEKWKNTKQDMEAQAVHIEEIRIQIEKGKRALLVEKFYSDYLAKKKEIDECEKQIKQLGNWIKDNEDNLENLKLLSVQSEQEYEKESPNLHAMITKIKESVDKYEELNKVILKLENAKEQIYKAENEIEEITKKKKEYETKYENLSQTIEELRYQEIVNNQAVILREKLIEGEPCPVCGSVHHNIESVEHKQKEELDYNSIIINSEKERKAVVQELNQFSDTIKRSERKLNDLKVKQGEYVVRIDALKEALIYDSKEQAETELKYVRDRLNCLEKQKNETGNQYKIVKEEMDQKVGAYKRETESLKRQKKSFIMSEKEYNVALKKQKFENTEVFKTAKLETTEMEKLEEKINDYRVQRELAESNIQRLQKETEGKVVVNTQKYEEERENLKTEKSILEKKDNIIYKIVSDNDDAYKKGCKLYEEREELKEKASVLNVLDNTANGRMSGRHMNFQTYIQRRYFKQIIHSANRRLYKISGNQFILQCREMKDLAAQGKVGLDLDVYSIVNEQSRDVKTLSGGESFMAALSMALGMADIIQNSAGSIHIDTMFIDEGFGTLSEETRNQAIEILNELSEGKRLVGIISHVSELKAQVETQLEVIKTDKGSKAQWN